MSDGTYFCDGCGEERMGMPYHAHVYGEGNHPVKSKEQYCGDCKNKVEEQDIEQFADRIVEQLTQFVNGGNERELGGALARVFQRKHRYLQNQAILAIAFFLSEYGKAKHFDARNEWAVGFGQRVVEVVYPPQSKNIPRLRCACGRESTQIMATIVNNKHIEMIIPSTWTIRRKTKTKDGITRITYECPICWGEKHPRKK
jgi:hypothetical protein